MPTKDVIAILCSDIHLSLTPPIARAGEPDWFAAMARPLNEIRNLNAEYNCPVLCAGDIFHRWNSPPELINFAIDSLPKMFAIPGQHDLPFHAVADIEKSAYWTLVHANIIIDIASEYAHIGYAPFGGGSGLDVYPFMWGEKVVAPKENRRDRIAIALIHAYTWMDSYGYRGAPEECNVASRLWTPYPGYDIAVIGDNHKGFLTKCGETVVFNCGGLIRRNSDEISYKPQVGLLHPDGTVTRHYLDTSQDIITPVANDAESALIGLDSFFEELRSLQAATLDFEEALNQCMERHQTGVEVRQVIREAVERGRDRRQY